MFSDTEDEGVDVIRGRAGGASFSWKGIKGGMTRFEVNTPRLNMWPEWEVPRGDIVHYGFSFEIEGPEGVPWEEAVSLPSTEQTLDDWNPIAPRGPASADIVKPEQGMLLVIGSGELVLDVTAGNASGNAMVELEWTHYVPGKDPSVEPYVVVHTAPRFVRLSDFPKSISFDLLNGLGRYGIRAKLKSSADNTWSDDRTFTLIDAEVHKTLVKAGALPKEDLSGQAGEMVKRDSATGVVLGPSALKKAAKDTGPRPAPTEPPAAKPLKKSSAPLMKTRSLPGRDPAGKDSLSRDRTLAAARKPDCGLVFDPLAVKGVPLEEGKDFDLIIPVRNTGSEACPATQEYSLSCHVDSGNGPCPFPTQERKLGKVIPANRSESIKIIGATAKRGRYTVKVGPAGFGIEGTQVTYLNVGPILDPGSIKRAVEPKQSSDPKQMQKK
jgi:hypothetical protein